MLHALIAWSQPWIGQSCKRNPVTSSLIANMSHKTKWSEMIWDGSSELARKSCREDLKDGGFLPTRKETMEFCWFLDGPRTQHHWLLWAMDEALLVAGNSQGIVDFRLQLLEMPGSGWILEIVKLLWKIWMVHDGSLHAQKWGAMPKNGWFWTNYCKTIGVISSTEIEVWTTTKLGWLNSVEITINTAIKKTEVIYHWFR